MSTSADGGGKQLQLRRLTGVGSSTYKISAYDSNSYAGHQNLGRPASRSVASATDIMNDQKGFDDSNSVGAIPAAAPDLLDFSEPPQQQPPPGQLPPQSHAMHPGSYPPQQQYGAPPQQQYGASPGQYPIQQQQPYGASPPMHQQYAPPQGQPQAYGGY